MAEHSPTLAVRVWGPYACFSRPELKVERVSYEVMTPAAARGVLMAILWKPAISWEVEAIEVHAPIEFFSIKRNEVGSRASTPSADVIAGLAPMPPFYIDDNRQQRVTLGLRDVNYVIRARFVFTPQKGERDNLGKFLDTFDRRVRKGQCFEPPFLGAREFAAHFGPPIEGKKPIPLTKPLGLMYHSRPLGNSKAPARFFNAKLVNGVMNVPPFAQAEPAPESTP
jgi:CRISPR-associated protein Cas5d